MRYLVTGKEMKLLDQNTTLHFHMPEQVLMEQAAMGFVRRLLSFFEGEKPSVLFVCGPGNNGADGIASARLLNQMGVPAAIYVCRRESPESDSLFGRQLQIYESYGYPEAEALSEQARYDCIVDAVFGTGLSRPVTGVFAEMIEGMNRMKGRKIALDIASGVASDTGELLGAAFLAEDTVTFSFGKAGQYLWPGAHYSGRIHIVPIGITKESFWDQKPQLAVLEESDLSLLPVRKERSHKGTYGRLLVIAGSVNMAGAAYFSAKAAYRCGTGLVRILTAEENRIVLQTSLPEAVLSVYGGQTLDQNRLQEELSQADAVVLGPGIGTGAAAEELVFGVLSNAQKPLVLDADALNLLAKQPTRLKDCGAPIIVTPHLKEMSRLTKEPVSKIQAHLLETAQSFAKTYGVVCVLKDAHTVTAVPDGLTFINLSGNNGMATGGSGDVLSGIIGALLAQGAKSWEAAALGVYLHGLAGDKARLRRGARGMTAEDITEGLTELWKKVEKYE